MQQAAEDSSLSAAEAARLLGIKLQTLYAYASRGLLRRVGAGKRRRYLLEDLQRLQARQRARAGHGPVAAAALAFGEPVLDSSITFIDARGPVYRGHGAVELAISGARFEAVAELLWTGALATAPRWEPLAKPLATLGDACSSLDELWLRFPALVQVSVEAASRAPDAELAQGRRLIHGMAALLVPPPVRVGAPSVAELLAHGARSPKSHARAALDLALVLLADHELNASSFTARVVASTDAPLSACMLAALCALSGPRHGGACDRVEALLDEAATLTRPGDVVERRIRRGDPLPGFGHPLYPRGDPRAEPLLERARALARRSSTASRQLAPCFALAARMQSQGLHATVDFALVALARALGMNAGAAALLFALGRSAGWVAHALEQRRSAAVLRPRARYVGD
jgi:citrate synthase